MRHPFHLVDAFTTRAFSGSPAGVVLLDRFPADETMRLLAAEVGAPETAFALAGPDGSSPPDPVKLRWFSAAMEIDLCGHATLATASVLFRERKPGKDTLRFETKSGILAVSRKDGLLELDLPARPGVPETIGDDLVGAVGAWPREALRARDIVVVFGSEDELRTISPDFGLVRGLDAFAVAATAPGNDVDYVLRFFAPKAGVDEDPATGSAHCTLAPYWAARLGKTRLRARQLSPRGAEFTLELRGDRVGVAGGTVHVVAGAIEFADAPAPVA